MPRKPRHQPTLVAFLLDRSGSMASCKQETISGFNGYLKSVATSNDMAMTVTQFDSQGIDILHDCTPIGLVQPLTETTYEPRGGTPLYDAIGKTIQATQEKAGKKYKVLFVVLTDGQENASSQFNQDTIKELIQQKENDSHWTFAYIGTGIEGWNAVNRIAQGTQSRSNVLRSSHAETPAAYASLSAMSMNFCKSAVSGQAVQQNVWGGARSPTENPLVKEPVRPSGRRYKSVKAMLKSEAQTPTLH